MDVFGLLKIPRLSGMPALPSATLASIAGRLNGGAERSDRVAEAHAQIVRAVPEWKAHIEALEHYRRQTVAEGADAARLAKIRAAAERAADELALLQDGEPFMRERLERAQAEERQRGRRRDHQEFRAELAPLLEAYSARAAN